MAYDDDDLYFGTMPKLGNIANDLSRKLSLNESDCSIRTDKGKLIVSTPKMEYWINPDLTYKKKMLVQIKKK